MKSFDGTAPIPRAPMPQADAVKLCPAEEPLVCISDMAQDVLLFEPRYYLAGIPGAIDRVYVRQTVLDRLLVAAKLLPAGYKLKIFDAWRPAAVQKALFYNYYERLKRQEGNAGLSEAELMALTRCFVSWPSEDPQRPFVHATGGAVDLTVVDEAGNALNMGTDFDDFTDEAHTACFEQSGDTTVRDNRRLLYNIMLAAGFTNFPSEWWHYDFGDQFWAAQKQCSAIYTGIYSEPI